MKKCMIGYRRYAILALLIILIPWQVNANEFNMKINDIKEDIKINGVIENGNINSIILDQRFNSIIIGLENVDKDSKISIAIPKNIIKETERFNEVEFIILADVKEVDANISQEGDKKIITFTVPALTEEVEIIITPEDVTVVPEFGIIAMLTLTLSIGILLMWIKRSAIHL